MEHDKYKDAQGRYRTESLFLELNSSTMEPVFTIKPYDHKGCVSFKRLYLEAEDPTGYKAAIDILGSWDHWKRLMSNHKIKCLVGTWAEELIVRLQSKALKEMLKTATTEGSKGTTAAKYIMEKGWEKKRGRPSANEVERERKIAAGLMDEFSEDVERMKSLYDS